MNGQLKLGLIAALVAVVGIAPTTTALSEDEKKPEEAREEGFTPLFDGESLEGWVKADGKAPDKGWVVEEGSIHRKDRGGDIYSEKEYGDFELRFEWKIARGANSGVKYKVKKFALSHLGPEYQVLDDENHNNGKNPLTCAGAMYELFPAGENKKLKPVGEWNTARIVVKGTKFEHWLNGEKIVEADTKSDEWKAAKAKSKFRSVEGYAENKTGRIMLQDHGDPVWFRKIRIMEFESKETEESPDAPAN